MNNENNNSGNNVDSDNKSERNRNLKHYRNGDHKYRNEKRKNSSQHLSHNIII